MINQTFLVGRLTKAAELRYSLAGVAIGTFTLAANRKFKSGDTLREEVLYLPCVTFGRPAEWIKDSSKGDAIAVAGRLKTEEWTKDNQKHSRIVLLVEELQRVELVFGKTEEGEPTEGKPPF